jgi:hypothetical protein
MLPDTEYTVEEQEQLLDRIADQIVRRRLQMPAALFLEMHRPLRFFAGQGLLFASPLLGAFFGLDQIYKFSRLVEDPATVDRLLQRIEERSREEQAFRCSGVPVFGPGDERPVADPTDGRCPMPEHPNT